MQIYFLKRSRFRNVVVGRFSYEKMCGRFPGRKKVAVITMRPYLRGDCKARFHCSFSFQFYRFSYDLGKGPAKIVSDLQVEMNQWNQLQVHREGVNGYLVLNGRRVTGSSALGASQLNLDTDMYLGGGVQGVSEK